MNELQSRLDLSEWIIHFVHDRNFECDPSANAEEFDEAKDYLPPLTFDNEPKNKGNFWKHQICIGDNFSNPIEPDADAFQVLQKIIDDAYIKSGWSIRNGHITIFGLWPAVCFTEMPFYALLHYAKNRKDFDSVNTYGICFKRQELFNAGVRPVIYGLSSKHKEDKKLMEECEEHYKPIILHETCGISLQEQYRYLPMSMKGKYIDWSHEREWRWSDPNYHCHVPGLPLFGKNEPFHFSELLILVNSSIESDEILNQLKSAFDAKKSNDGYDYDINTLRNTYVISLEEIKATLDSERIKAIRIEELPLSNLKSFQVVQPSSSFIQKVKRILDEANQAAIEAFKQWKNDHNEEDYPCGFAWIEIYESQSELVQALIALNKVNVYGGVRGYRIADLNRGIITLSLDAKEFALEAAKKVLKKEFPEIQFKINNILD